MMYDELKYTLHTDEMIMIFINNKHIDFHCLTDTYQFCVIDLQSIKLLQYYSFVTDRWSMFPG